MLIRLSKFIHSRMRSLRVSSRESTQSHLESMQEHRSFTSATGILFQKSLLESGIKGSNDFEICSFFSLLIPRYRPFDVGSRGTASFARGRLKCAAASKFTLKKMHLLPLWNLTSLIDLSFGYWANFWSFIDSRGRKSEASICRTIPKLSVLDITVQSWRNSSTSFCLRSLLPIAP